MLVEITGYEIRKDGSVHLYVTDCSEERLQRVERTRDDRIEEIELEFFGRNAIAYLSKWLKHQKSVKGAQVKTWRDACQAVVGTVTNISMKYRVWD